MIWTTLTVTENNIETELIISELTWIALYAQLLKILISSWNCEVLFVEPEVLRKNKTSFTGRDGQCVLLLLLLCCCWRTASGCTTAPPTDLEYVPLDTSSGLKHWITLDCCCILMIWQWWKLLLFFQAVNKKKGEKTWLVFFFQVVFQNYQPLSISTGHNCVVGKLRLTYLK